MANNKATRNAPRTTALERKSYASTTNLWNELPFVLYRKEGGVHVTNNWHVPPVADYGDACDIGRNFAAHFLQYSKDNPQAMGSLLGWIASDIDFTDQSASKGYWIGFFSHIQRYLQAGCDFVGDVFDDLQAIEDRYARNESARKREISDRVARMNAARKTKRVLAQAKADPNFQKLMARLKGPPE